MTSSAVKIEKATEIVAYYTLAASATGAVPVPASSVAVVVEDGIMLAHIADALGVETITIKSVMASIGFAGSLNIVGKALFIEGAKLLSWGTGSVWAAVGLSALGASTAGVQTYIIGKLAIAIGKNQGSELKGKEGKRIVEEAKSDYDTFVSHWKAKKPARPVRVR